LYQWKSTEAIGIGKENGTAAPFMSFCSLMVNTGWLVHDKILIMDMTSRNNSKVHLWLKNLQN
jgi:hypothetical protein